MRRATLRLLVAGTVLTLSASFGRADSFTLSPGSPTLPLVVPPATPADILYDTLGIPGPPPPPPSIGIPFGPGGMGLLPADVVDALSDGLDPVMVAHTDYFSVTPGSAGAPGSGVAAQVAADTPPGLTPGHASDLYVHSTPMGPTNILAPAGFGWTLGTTTGDEFNAGLSNPGDNVNSYDLATIPVGAAKYFSLAPGSPTLAGLGATPADILAVGGPFGPAPVMFLPGGAIGLPPGTDIDALAIFVAGGPFGGPGTIEYSLTTATSGLVGASGADILGFGPGVVLVHPAVTLGLLPGDDLDALDVDPQIIVPEPAMLSLVVVGGSLLALRRGRRPRRREPQFLVRAGLVRVS